MRKKFITWKTIGFSTHPKIKVPLSVYLRLMEEDHLANFPKDLKKMKIRFNDSQKNLKDYVTNLRNELKDDISELRDQHRKHLVFISAVGFAGTMVFLSTRS